MNQRSAHLTEREEQILVCIRQSIVDPEKADHGGDRCGGRMRSKGTVAYHLRNLQERGVLARDGRGWRGYRPAR